jgi:flagellar assembly protein FliH
MAQKALYEEYCRVDDSLLSLAMRVAKRLTGLSLELEPRKLLDIARTLVLLPKEREGWCLHIAPEDGDWLKALSAEDQLPCPWVVDETLAQGDCFLECQEGIFDARVEAQLEKMEMILREEIRNERLESTSPES